MESTLNLDLEMYPDIPEMLDGVSVGDTIKVTACFQVKELTGKRITGSFDDDEDIKITKKDGEEGYEEGPEESEDSEDGETSG